MTANQMTALSKRRETFVSTVLFLSDASPRTVQACGYKNKETWLGKLVADYRKDVHKILGD